MKTVQRYSLIGALLCCGIVSAGPNEQQQPKIDCDSTCLTPKPMEFNKINRAITSRNVGGFQYNAVCGASAGSILPSAPDGFLCKNGTAGSVVSATTNGETLYKWSCNAMNGSQSNCTAEKREVGMCGASNGASISTTPSHLCAAGSANGYSFNGFKYSWFCKGNYGAKASCSANHYTPEPPVYVPGCPYKIITNLANMWTIIKANPICKAICEGDVCSIF